MGGSIRHTRVQIEIQHTNASIRLIIRLCLSTYNRSSEQRSFPIFLWHSHIHVCTLQSLTFIFLRWRLRHNYAIYALESVLICTTLSRCVESNQMKWTCILLCEKIVNGVRLWNSQEFTPVYNVLRKFQGVCAFHKLISTCLLCELIIDTYC